MSETRSEDMKGNMQSTIDHAEMFQARRRAILARYPDASEVQGDYIAPSAAADATSLMVEQDMIVAIARLSPDCSRLATPEELPVHVRSGGMNVENALQALKEQHPEAYAQLLAIVANGERFDKDEEIPW